MLDFSKFTAAAPVSDAFDLLAIFERLDRKSSHTEPRPSQREAMEQLTARHQERDLVLKISTGAGKTTVGLLYLYAHMRMAKGPVVFLCPTVQLVQQTLAEASQLGIRASHYAAREPHPDPECMRGEGILVCTYDKLFNAKTTFDRSDVRLLPVAVVLDDAHAGVELVRKSFTLSLTGAPLEKLKAIIGASCSQYHRTRWLDIEAGDPHATLEVPFWIWSEYSEQILQQLHEYSDSDLFKFVWPYLQRGLARCRCVISGTQAEIAPDVLPVELVRGFDKAAHRLFMSATIADDSVLVRELNIAPESALNPISPPSDRGLGERMVIAPSLVDPALERKFVMDLCSDIAKTHNVVVLAPSEQLARDWEDVGACVFIGDSFSEGVRLLKQPSCAMRFAVFVQRYDGVDLPDDVCRVLVIDGLPTGEGVIDRHDASQSIVPGGVRNKLIYRIEQGMGRAVRSHADYAVVLLAGQELASFVGRQQILEAMTHDSRNQINLSFELAKILRMASTGDPAKAVHEAVSQCLNRVQSWKDFYNQKVRSIPKDEIQPNNMRISISSIERRAHDLCISNRFPEAKEIMSSIVGDAPSAEEQGVLLQRLASIVQLYDPTEALKLQQGAYEKNRTLLIPPAAIKKPLQMGSKTVAMYVCEWFRAFHNGNAAVAAIRTIRAEGAYVNKAHRIEEAWRLLGEALGAISTRPDDEFRVGPDNLWLWGEWSFVIEAKNERGTVLPKEDAGQQHQSMAWFHDNYPTRNEKVIPVVVAKAEVLPATDAIFLEGSLKISQDGFDKLCANLEGFCLRLTEQGPVFVVPDNVHRLMGEYGLLPEQFAGKYASLLK